MNLKHSFNELKKPILWIHYALGAGLIILIYEFLIKQSLFPELNLQTILLYYLIYVGADRLIHGVLEI